MDSSLKYTSMSEEGWVKQNEVLRKLKPQIGERIVRKHLST